MTLPAIIIMVIGIIAAIVGVNKQKQGASWGQALAIVGAIIAIGAAVWNFVGTLNGDQKGIQKNQRAQQLRGLYLGKEIANSQTSFTPFVVAGVFYYLFNVIVDYVMGRVEKRLDYYR